MSLQTIIGGDPEAAVHPSSVVQACVMGVSTWATTDLSLPQPTAGKYKKLRVELPGAPGDGKQYVIALYKGGVETSLTVTIAGTDTSAEITVDVSVAQGDLMVMKSTPTGTPTARGPIWYLDFEPTIPDESIHFCYIANEKNSNGTAYHSLVSGNGSEYSAVTNAYTPMPCAGTIKKFFAKVVNAPGVGNTRDFTIYKDGGDTPITCQITGAATVASDLVNTQVVAAGNLLSTKLVNASSPTSSKYGWSFVFLASVEGQFPIFNSGGTPLVVDAVRYMNVCGSKWGWNWDDTEANIHQIANVFKIIAVYVALAAAPGAGKSYQFRLRKNAGNGNNVLTIADAAVSGNVTDQTDEFASGDKMTMQATPTGTPASVYMRFGLCAIYEAAVGGQGGPAALLVAQGEI